MNLTINPQVQRGCAYCAPFVMTFFFLGLLVAGWLPPPSPGDSATEVARMYQDNTDAMRIGFILIAIGGTLYAPLIVAISMQMRRIEGPFPALAWIQFGLGLIGGPAFFIIPTFFWETAAFEPFRDPQITEALHDAGWIPLMSAIWPQVGANIAIAIAVFTDRGEEAPNPARSAAATQRVFPRWIGYFNLWIALLYVPAGLVLFFHDGPFAWNGIMTFWIAAPAFAVWCVVMMIAVLRAIRQQE